MPPPPVNRVRYQAWRFAANEQRTFMWTVAACAQLQGFRLHGEVGLALVMSLAIDGVEMLAPSRGVPLEVLAGVFAAGNVISPTWKPGAALTLHIWNTSYDPAIIRIRPLVRGDELDLIEGEPS